MADEAPRFEMLREFKILNSGIRDVFTPYAPIEKFGNLIGREHEVISMLETLHTPGQHAFLYGERGVGKSSIANVVATLCCEFTKRSLYVKRCDHTDTFETIVVGPLKAVGHDLTLRSVKKNTKKGGRLSLKAPVVEAGVDAGLETTREYETVGRLSPSTVAEALHGHNGLLLIDEGEALESKSERRKLAELIKHLSDNRSPFKIMVVGISEVGGELTSEHKSVARCLKELRVNRISDVELRGIIQRGCESSKVKIAFESDVAEAIVKLSAGYPHFTHLLALKCAERVVGDDRRVITRDDFMRALSGAVNDAEITLRSQYQQAVRSARISGYEEVLMAAAQLESGEFSAKDIYDVISNHDGGVNSQQKVSSYLRRLITEQGGRVLRRTGQGIYRFEDPRMQSYVRIAHKAGTL